MSANMNVIVFLAGIYMATFAAAGLFFLKFYLESRDRFFLYFCWACWLISLERVVLLCFPGAFQATSSTVIESHFWIYVIRLAAYLLILYAVVGKNLKARG